MYFNFVHCSFSGDEAYFPEIRLAELEQSIL